MFAVCRDAFCTFRAFKKLLCREVQSEIILFRLQKTTLEGLEEGMF